MFISLSITSSRPVFFLVFVTAICSVLLFPSTEEMVEGKSAILIGMSQWNSNDLVEQIETIGKLEENQGNVWLALHVNLKLTRKSDY